MKLPDTPLCTEGCARTNRWMSVMLLAITLVAALITGGCATVPATHTATQHDDLVATDLVSAMIQLDELDPITTTLQYSTPATAFGRSVIAGLRQAGYGLQRVDLDHGSAYVSYAMRYAETNSGTVTDYLIQVGDIELRREYRISNGRFYPASLLFITGASDTSQVVIDPALFTQQGGEMSFLSGVQSAHTSLTGIRDIDQARSVPAARGKIPTSSERMDAIRVRHTLSSLNRSASKARLAPVNRQALQQLVLVQPTDNHHFIGINNKRSIHTLLEAFRQGDELVLTACSAVRSETVDTNQYLVRVSEALLYAGVDRNALRQKPCVGTGLSQASHRAIVTIVHHRVQV